MLINQERARQIVGLDIWDKKEIGYITILTTRVTKLYLNNFVCIINDQNYYWVPAGPRSLPPFHIPFETVLNSTDDDSKHKLLYHLDLFR